MYKVPGPGPSTPPSWKGEQPDDQHLVEKCLAIAARLSARATQLQQQEPRALPQTPRSAASMGARSVQVIQVGEFEERIRAIEDAMNKARKICKSREQVLLARLRASEADRKRLAEQVATLTLASKEKELQAQVAALQRRNQTLRMLLELAQVRKLSVTEHSAMRSQPNSEPPSQVVTQQADVTPGAEDHLAECDALEQQSTITALHALSVQMNAGMRAFAHGNYEDAHGLFDLCEQEASAAKREAITQGWSVAERKLAARVHSARKHKEAACRAYELSSAVRESSPAQAAASSPSDARNLADSSQQNSPDHFPTSGSRSGDHTRRKMAKGRALRLKVIRPPGEGLQMASISAGAPPLSTSEAANAEKSPAAEKLQSGFAAVPHVLAESSATSTSSPSTSPTIANNHHPGSEQTSNTARPSPSAKTSDTRESELRRQVPPSVAELLSTKRRTIDSVIETQLMHVPSTPAAPPDTHSRWDDHARDSGVDAGAGAGSDADADADADVGTRSDGRERQDQVPANPRFMARARAAYVAQREDELSFEAGDRLEILEADHPWWIARPAGRQGGPNDEEVGLVPSNFLQRVEVAPSPSAAKRQLSQLRKSRRRPPSIEVSSTDIGRPDLPSSLPDTPLPLPPATPPPPPSMPPPLSSARKSLSDSQISRAVDSGASNSASLTRGASAPELKEKQSATHKVTLSDSEPSGLQPSSAQPSVRARSESIRARSAGGTAKSRITRARSSLMDQMINDMFE